MQLEALNMQIIPAIDIQGGKVVRLTKGKFEDSKIYSNSPVEVAKKWKNQNTGYLHVIDLDGAKTGKLVNLGQIEKIVKSSSLSIQVGGGIRDRKITKQLLDIGVDRVILGTIVEEKFDVFKELIKEFRNYIMVALDIKDSKIVSRGWITDTDLNYISFVKKLERLKVPTVIFTDTLKDGTLTYPNFTAIERLLDSTDIPVIASGGISDIDHVKKLYSWRDRGLKGIILGKALYENKISLKECIERYGD